MYRSVFYFNFQPLTLESANKLIEKVITSSPNKIEKFGLSSDRMKVLKVDGNAILNRLVTGYPEYFFGSLFLADKKGDSLFYLEHLPDQFFRVDIAFSQKISAADRSVFFEDFVNQIDILFGLMDKTEEYDKKHLNITKQGEAQTEEYTGYDFYQGIPGIYEWTYFGSDFSKSFDLKELKQTKKSKYGYILNCVDSMAEKNAMNYLGEDYFFDINKPNKKSKVPEQIQVFVEQIANVKRSIRPQYRDFDFNIDAKIAVKIFHERLESNIENGSFASLSIDGIESVIRKVLDNSTSDELKSDLAMGCGYFLGKYWSQKFSIDFDTNLGLTFRDGDNILVLNPYNTVMLMIQDNLKIQDIEDCVSHLS